MLKYFLIIFVFAILFILGIWGTRDGGFSRPPLRIFPDMDEQDRISYQQEEELFPDGMGSRLPVRGAIPQGEEGGIEFSEGQEGFYYTGIIDDFYGSGLPLKEMGIKRGDAKAIEGLLRRGKGRFNIHCSICHGLSGNGLGVMANSSYGVPGIANFHLPNFEEAQYPNGKMFEVISEGKGQMGGYKANIGVRDRWAIVAYVRALQEARKKEPKASKLESVEKN